MTKATRVFHQLLFWWFLLLDGKYLYHRFVLVNGHARLECPPPLSGKTGEKAGPCDSSLDDGSVPAYPLKANALNTITWLESISHPGAPVRFALSKENDIGGFETCLLLDHVPHDALSRPNYRDASTWHRSSITLWIPDIYCERCHLQLISVMSDIQHGVPADTKCIYKGAAEAGITIARQNSDDKEEIESDEEDMICPAVYHSCAPVSINGSIPRNNIDRCNTTQFEEQLDWPLTPSANADLYQHSVYFNRGDVGLYTETDATLIEIGYPLTDVVCTNALYCDPDVSFDPLFKVPENAFYTSLEGSCAAVTKMQVEAYQSGGILPSVPKEGEDVSMVIVKNDDVLNDGGNDDVDNSFNTDANVSNSAPNDGNAHHNDSASASFLLLPSITSTVALALLILVGSAFI